MKAIINVYFLLVLLKSQYLIKASPVQQCEFVVGHMYEKEGVEKNWK